MNFQVMLLSVNIIEKFETFTTQLTAFREKLNHVIDDIGQNIQRLI